MCSADDDPTMHDVPRRERDLSVYRDVKGYNRYRDELIVAHGKYRSPSEVYANAERQDAKSDDR